MIARIDISGINGTPIRAVLVQAGEQRPNHPFVTEKDLIEFYDLRHKHTPDGQFIAEYYAETYMGRDKWGSHPIGAGLDLYGSEPDWKIDGRTRTLVGEWYDYLSFKGWKGTL